MEKIRVLVVGADNIGFGGRSTIAYNLAINMNEQCIENDFLTFKKIDPYFERRIVGKGGEIFRVVTAKRNSIFRKILTAKKVIKIMKKNQFDIVHIHADTAIEAMRTIILCRLSTNAKIIIHAHSSGSAEKASHIKRLINNICEYLIRNEKYVKCAVTQDAAKYMFGDPIAPLKVNIVHNGIELEKYTFNLKIREKLRVKLKLQNYFVVGCVARFTKIKNFFFLLNLFRELLNKEEQAKLVLVGDGPLKPEVKEYAKKIGIQENVLFLGNRKDVANILQTFDVFVLTSIHEGLGLVNIEAQASGLPCVVSDGIPREAKILRSFSFMNLSSKKIKWVNKILETRNYKRKDTNEKIKFAGYDIVDSANFMQKIYFMNKIN